MPGYLDYQQGDISALGGIGNALNSNLAQLVHLRQQQGQFDQENALKAAMLALEQKKVSLQAPLWQSEASHFDTEAEKNRLANLAQQNLMRDQDIMQRVVGQQYQYGHPVHQAMQPPLPMGNDLFLTTNMGAALANQGAPVNVNSPYMAGTSGEADDIRNAAVQHALAARTMLGHPETAAMLYNGLQVGPGHTVFNPLTSQAVYTAPDETRDALLGIRAENAASLAQSRLDNADHQRRMEAFAKMNAMSNQRRSLKPTLAEVYTKVINGQDLTPEELQTLDEGDESGTNAPPASAKSPRIRTYNPKTGKIE